LKIVSELKISPILFLALLGLPSAALAEKEALKQYQLCLLDQLSQIVSAEVGNITSRRVYIMVFERIAPRCWIENKMAAWEAAVDAIGIEEARSARLSDVASDLEQAIISDLVTDLLK